MFASSLKDDDLHLSTSLVDMKDATGGKSGEAGRSTKFSQRITSGVKRPEQNEIKHTIIHEEDSSSLKTVSPLTDLSRKSKKPDDITSQGTKKDRNYVGNSLVSPLM